MSIPKYECVEVDAGECTSLGVTKSVLQRYLGWHEACAFLNWYVNKYAETNTIADGEVAYFLDAVFEWLELRKCTKDHPNLDSSEHEYEFGYEASGDHGDEIWFCKHCKKRIVKEGSDY